MPAELDARAQWARELRARLDARYDQSTVVPDPSPWFQAWRDGSERARRLTRELRADISYGSGDGERIDLYLPHPDPSDLPFAAFVDGNPSPTATRLDGGYPAPAVHGNGAALVVVGYDRRAGLAKRAEQVSRAWEFLATRGAQFGLDPTRGHLLGYAGGAHLAALAAFDPEAPLRPVSAVLVSGIYDVAPLLLTSRSGELGLDRESVPRLSPIRSIPRDGPTLTIAWGGRELEEYRRQSVEFARAVRARGLDTRFGELQGRNHYETSFELADRHSDLLASLRH